MADLELTKMGHLKFLVRKGSSDIKAIEEVVKRRGYRRSGFEVDGPKWIDLGANVGAFAILAAFGGAKVIAYEPEPATFEILKRNVALNGFEDQITLYNRAVVADPSKKYVAFSVNSANGNYWRSSTVHKWRGGELMSVRAEHWTTAVKQGWDVKMDIEGAEMPVLEAMVKAGQLPPRLVYEWSFDIDGSIPRFQGVVAGLRKAYKNVAYSRFDETVPVWGASWFPPCRTVWCW